MISGLFKLTPAKISLVYIFFVIFTPIQVLAQSNNDAIVKNFPYLDTAEATCTPTGDGGGVRAGNVVVIGDSLTDPQWPGSSTQAPGEVLQSKFNSNGWSLSVFSNAGRSATKAKSVVEGTNIPEAPNATNPSSAMPADAIAGASAVVFALGSNDSTDISTSIHDAVAAVKAKNADVKIFWVDVASNIKGPSVELAQDDATNYRPVNQAIHNSSAAEGYTVVSWFKKNWPDKDPKQISKDLPDTPNLAGDRLHLSAAGVNEFATLIEGAVKGSDTIPPDQISAPSAAGDPASVSTVDPAAMDYYNENMKSKIEALAPLYQRAAQETGIVDWELLPALHNLEFGLSKTNPTVAESYGPDFITVYQMGRASLDVNEDLSLPMFQYGHENTDDEFVYLSKLAIEGWLKPFGSTLGIDLTQSIQPADAGKLVAAYKSGPGSVWFTGAADFNLHAYAWAGFDTTDEHKLPMAWGPGSPFGDEKPSDLVTKPGAATTFVILKGGVFGSTGCDPTTGVNNGGPYVPITKSREEMVTELLSLGPDKVTWAGCCSSVDTQKADVADPAKTSDNLVRVMLAMATQSGAVLRINVINSGHGGGGPHTTGDAVDIGYYGSFERGQAQHDAQNGEGDKMYAWLFTNATALNVNQLIWQYPLDKQCYSGQPVDCDTYFAPWEGPGRPGRHDHHIHLGTTR